MVNAPLLSETWMNLEGGFKTTAERLNSLDVFWMYPKLLMDLSGWHLNCVDLGNMHHFVGADFPCISWSHAQCGELGDLIIYDGKVAWCMATFKPHVFLPLFHL